jgi:hypothetical protein
MRIALGAVLVLALVWFVALRPKSESGTAPTPATPPTAAQPNSSDKGTGLLDRPNQAQSAVNSANAKNSANEQKATQTGAGASTTASTPQTPAQTGKQTAPPAKVQPAPRPKSTPKSTDPSAAIIASAKRGHTEVMLFWDSAGSDDRHTRAALQQVNTRHGTVKVHAIPIKDVGKYTAITADVKINVSPTIVIISPKLQAWRITGYTDTGEINGLVGSIARQSEK